MLGQGKPCPDSNLTESPKGDFSFALDLTMLGLFLFPSCTRFLGNDSSQRGGSPKQSVRNTFLILHPYKSRTYMHY
jgi:hypothetical protein